MANPRLSNPLDSTRFSSPIPQRPRFFVFLVVTLASSSVETRATIRPETVLLNALTKPFEPTKWSSPECQRDSAIYVEELARYTPWALKMYDASVKIPNGVITGNYRQLGNYEECLRIKTDRGISGQSCSANVQFEIAKDSGIPRELDLGDLLVNVAVASNSTKWRSGTTIVYEWTWCVPSSCNHSEVQEFLEIALDPLKVEGRVDFVVNVPTKSCRTLETDRVIFEPVDWIYVSILIIFAIIVIASTTFDIAFQGRPTTLNRKGKKYILFSSFSFYTNCKNLFNTDRHQDSIACLDGLRFLSICWIIYGHTYYIEVMGIKMDLTEIPKMHENWSSMLVLNGNMVTDTFFLLSGILLAYTETLKKEKASNWKFDIFGLYVHRYLRLTPAYAMMIGFYATIYHKFGSGPHWDAWVGSNRDHCRENWWTNLLYVNNYVNVPDMCLSQSWYLATDMQLIWLSPIFLYPMLKPARATFFWILIGLAFLLSILLPFFVTFIYRFTATMLYYKEQSDVANVFLYIYTRVYTRAGPYIIGIALGHLLAKRHSYNIKIRTPYIVCGWLIAVPIGLSAVFGAREMYFDDHPYNRLEASIYAGLHRHAFALTVSWVIFSSVHGFAGLVGEFLSWRGWTPLSRLTYTAYLCHYIFLLSRAGSVRTTGDLTSMSMMYTFLGNLSFTMALSLIWSLTFEIPFMTLDRTLLSRKDKNSCFLSKEDRARMFASSESNKEIYRTIEESSTSTMAEIYKNVANCESVRSICDSNGTVGYYVTDEEENNKGVIKSKGRVVDDEEVAGDGGGCIYVIGDSEIDGNRNSFRKANLEEGRARTS